MGFGGLELRIVIHLPVGIQEPPSERAPISLAEDG
jgi:hypothetical protein